MREADRRTILEIGIPSIVLMENAGRQVVAAMEATFGELGDKRVAVIAGRGNNGGDGFVVARTLLQRGVDVSVFLLAAVSDVRGDARTNLEILGRLGVTAVEVTNGQDWELHFSDISACDVIVDAIFGTGLKSALEGMLQTVVADVNSSGIPVVAIDLPSGLSADTHEVPGDAIDAVLTVTLGAPKVPLVLPPAERHCGDLVIADIGIPEAVIDGLDGPHLQILTREAMREVVLPRANDAHKGDFGRVVVVAGSLGKTGPRTWPRSERCVPARASPPWRCPAKPCRSWRRSERSTRPSRCRTPITVASRSRPSNGSWNCRPTSSRSVRGWGRARRRGPSCTSCSSGAACRWSSTPMRSTPSSTRRRRCGAATAWTSSSRRILARWRGWSGPPSRTVQRNRVEVAREFATSHQVHVVLKGHRTVIATPEGHVSINLTGNPGMATGGSGDVLTGMIAAWFAQLLDAEAACQLAVYLHGVAGDLAEADEGPHAMIAGDIVAHLGDAVLELTARHRRVNGPRADAES